MAKNKDKVFSKVAETAKESDMMRMRRIDGSQNGATLRTRVVRDKTKYNRNFKHKKSLADAGDFPFYGELLRICQVGMRFFRYFFKLQYIFEIERIF
jgi:hypothetical protein